MNRTATKIEKCDESHRYKQLRLPRRFAPRNNKDVVIGFLPEEGFGVDREGDWRQKARFLPRSCVLSEGARLHAR